MRIEDDYGNVLALPNNAKLRMVRMGKDRDSRESQAYFVEVTPEQAEPYDGVDLYYRTREGALRVLAQLEELVSS